MSDTEHSQDKSLKAFQKLIPRRVRKVLWISSLYDSYLVEEEGRLHELVRREYQGLNLIDVPEIFHAATAPEALEALQEGRFDLIIMTPHIKDTPVVRLAHMMRNAGFDVPIILLVFDNNERRNLRKNYDLSIFERTFIWLGDFRLIVAIIKSIEDRMNVKHDTEAAGVQSIILIEDNVKFYSSYLPLIYTELIKQSQRLVSEGINLTHKFLRMRARPKIILCTTYEEAWDYYQQYEEFILGIISDMNFKKNGVADPLAGLKFVKSVHMVHADIPALLQSSSDQFASQVRAAGATFLQKGSPRLLHELSEFITGNFGFGDFVFRMPDGTVVGRAENLRTLEETLKVVPSESIMYHGQRNHFSNWLKARTEFSLGHKLRPHRAMDFSSAEELREFLISSLRDYRETRTRGVITEFYKETFDTKSSFARIGGGSLGGKARGLGFVKSLLTRYNLRNRFKGVEVLVPAAVVIGTDTFDQFMEANQLVNSALSPLEDAEITRRFLDAKIFPRDIMYKLSEFLDLVREPLAVRSSSLLEDSQYQPFAGVYQTYMLPNNDPDSKVRLRELLESIKRVYASTFFRQAKDYMRATEYRLEEEKMAVVIQRIIGSTHKSRNASGCTVRHYPDLAGVAKSYNFYPVAPQKPTDGIAVVGLGLGKTVVDGGNAVRFCPKYPKHLPQFSSARDTLRNSQQEFFALNLHADIPKATESVTDILVQRFDLDEAEKDGTLFYSGSTYSVDNDAVYDGLSRSGQRIVTLAPILKSDLFPIAEILSMILELGSSGMGSPIEIEFAINMKAGQNGRKEFGILQMRPMVLSGELEALDIENVKTEDLLVRSGQALGNGVISGIKDIILVNSEKFDRIHTREVAHEIAQLNRKLLNEKKPYLLIGVGRWGSLDPWLGIPVTWDQISGAAAIVEADFSDISVAPSQGSHFFQNLTSFRVGYFTVSDETKTDFVDWTWLKSRPLAEEKTFTQHLTLEVPIVIKINGHINQGIILK